MQVKAAVSRSADSPFQIEEVDLSGPRAGEILVRLVASGICHTDLITKASWPSQAGPVILGHEGAGVVVEAGAGVEGVGAGDHVLLSFSSCGACASCSDGAPSYCATFRALNMPRLREDAPAAYTRDGEPVLSHFFGQSSFASYAIVAAGNAVVVDRDLDLVTNAPLGCGIQTGAGAILNVLAPRRRQSVVIIGLGGVGLAALMAARAIEVETVIGVDLVRGRREMATSLGASAVIDPTAGGLVEQILESTGGGADRILDTTGVDSVIADAARALNRLGVLALVGIGSPQATVDPIDLIVGGKSIRGCTEGDGRPQEFLPKLLQLRAAGRFPLEKIISQYAFADINTAVAEAKAGKAIKPVLVY